jgi:hypothetical protein
MVTTKENDVGVRNVLIEDVKYYHRLYVQTVDEKAELVAKLERKRQELAAERATAAELLAEINYLRDAMWGIEELGDEGVMGRLHSK